MESSKRDGLDRTLTKLRHRLNRGEYYEAHQLYRTLSFRYVSQQRYSEAIDLLRDGAVSLLRANQISSGADLGLLLISTLDKAGAPISDKNIECVSCIHRLIERSHIERQNYVQAAVRWSRQRDSIPSTSTAQTGGATAAASTASTSVGHPSLHAQFALTYWQELDYAQARYHFIRSSDGKNCAAMLIEYHIVRGFPSEVDLFIAQAVFQFLCLQNKLMAEVCFNQYTSQHPQVERGPPFVRPLLNFLWMLLLAVDGGNLAVFTVLCEQYQLALQRDPTYADYLNRIGELFFHLPSQRPKMPGLFGNLLSSLMSSYDDDISDDGPSDEQRIVTEPSTVDLD